MLLSGGGVVALGLVAMGRENATKTEALAQELERGALATAQLVRQALHDPALTDRAAPDDRVVLRAGRIALPEPLASLEQRWKRAPELPGDAGDAIASARRLEFVSGDRAGARALLASARERLPGVPELTLAAAWCADRDADVAARDALLAVGDEPHDATHLLLLAKSGEPLPAWAEDALLALAPEQSLGALARLSEMAPGRDLGAVEAAVEAAARHRTALRIAARELAKIAEAGGNFVIRHEDRLIVGHAQAGEGAAATFDGYGLLDSLSGRSPIQWRGIVQIRGHENFVAPGSTLPAIEAVPDAVTVYSMESIVMALAPLGHLLELLLLVLAATFVLGCSAALFALRRETRAMAARAEFLTSVTHELKTPLAGIRLLAEMLDEGRVENEQKRAEYQRRIAGETMRLSTLIENVLDLGRIERGERSYDRRVQDLRDVVREAGELFAVVAARDGLAFEMRLDEREGMVRADRGAVAQALWNVLDNARKYAAAGQRIELVQTGGTVAVRDFGPGVPEAERERVFAKFRRGDAQRDGSVPGLGLGLHLSRAIARAHGGTLACRAPDGPGALFVLKLPLDPPPGGAGA